MERAQPEERRAPRRVLEKCPTGIAGLDEITTGGLPRGRPTLVAGRAGCGKTVLAMEFLVRGARQHGENGVFVSFEERPQDLLANFASFGFGLEELVEQEKLFLEWIRVERDEIEETGDYDLTGLFLRLADAVETVGAQRIVLDTVESLFSGLRNEAILRAELRRLFNWFKDKGLTAVITGEAGGGDLVTRQGLEEYVSDCVIVLDHRVSGQLSTRRLRVAKYRGSAHGTNEYPFLIQPDGIELMPITALSTDYEVWTERVSLGIPRLDGMFEGGGVYRGSTVLVSGTAGTGKSTLATHAVARCCADGGRALYITFEESVRQVLRNMRSAGLDLQPWIDRGALHFVATRPDHHGLEMHLLRIQSIAQSFRPDLVVLDPVTNFMAAGGQSDVKQMLTRLIDFLKAHGVTTLMTSLTHGSDQPEQTNVMISSLIDTLLLLEIVRVGGERNRLLSILKSRGMGHSNQAREYRLTARGFDLVDVYVGPEGVLTGAARAAQEARERAARVQRAEEVERKRRVLDQRRQAIEAQIALLRSEFSADEANLLAEIRQAEGVEEALREDRQGMARRRGADAAGPAPRTMGDEDGGRRGRSGPMTENRP